MTSIATTSEHNISLPCDTDMFNPENIRALAVLGLKFLKKKLSKSSITSGEAFLEFMDFEETYDKSNKDDIEYTQLFCLAITMINQSEKIDSDTRDKMITCMIKQYAKNV